MTAAVASLSGLDGESVVCGKARWRTVFIGAAAIIGVTVAAVVGTNAWLAYWCRGLSFADMTGVPSRDIAIVPGSRVTSEGPGRLLRARLEAALALYRAGRVRAILVSGAETPSAPEVSVMRSFLRQRGVPEPQILTDTGGSRTRQTMNRAAGLYEVTNAIVCTQTVNMPRTLYLARAAGIDAIGVALPTNLSESTKYMTVEAFKGALAVAESALRSGPTQPAAERRGRAFASR